MKKTAMSATEKKIITIGLVTPNSPMENIGGNSKSAADGGTYGSVAETLASTQVLTRLLSCRRPCQRLSVRWNTRNIPVAMPTRSPIRVRNEVPNHRSANHPAPPQTMSPLRRVDEMAQGSEPGPVGTTAPGGCAGSDEPSSGVAWLIGTGHYQRM
jgi:hypothetical protein